MAVLHSPVGIRHPAPMIHHINPKKKDQMKDKEEEIDEEEGKLDLIPHQLRGSLATFTQIAPMVSGVKLRH